MNVRKADRWIVALGLAVASQMAMAEGIAYGRAQAPAPIEGTWEVRLTPTDCVTGVPATPFAFDSYMTFGAGGTVVETTSNPAFLVGQRSIGLGNWTRTGRTSYQMAFQAFVQIDGANRQRGTQRVDVEVDLVDGDHWTAVADIAFRNTAGATYFTGCAVASAVRMP